MLTVACFRWHTPGYRSQYAPETVLVLRDSIQRNYPDPHRFVCVTDDPAGLDDVETLPIWTDHSEFKHPNNPDVHPACYRRLKVFAPEMRKMFGDRFVCLDLDCVIVGDLRPLWNRKEDFVGLAGTQPPNYYNGSMFLMTAGSRARVWDEFNGNPKHCIWTAKRAGHYGSDQAWMSHALGASEATWTTADGVYSYRLHIKPHGGVLPQDARLVTFQGKGGDPWTPALFDSMPWIQKHWTRGVAA